MIRPWFSVAVMDDASLRVSDADRDRAVITLREHLLAGRLTLEEFSERVDAVLRARFGRELAQVQDDLPAVFADTVVASRRKPARITTALLSHVVRRGRLRLCRWTVAGSVLGDLDFDLREVTIDRQRTAVIVLAVLGNSDIYVPDGVNVEVSGVSVLGHRRDWGRDEDHPDAPTVQVRVLGLAGTVDVWRVPPGLQAGSYSDITRTLQGRPLRALE